MVGNTVGFMNVINVLLSITVLHSMDVMTVDRVVIYVFTNGKGKELYQYNQNNI